MEVKRKVIVVSCVVGFLGLLSAVTAFAAEAKRIKDGEVEFSSGCKYATSPALGLGLTAAISLLVAHIIVNVASGCVCCRKHPHLSNFEWTLALSCYVVSWFFFVVAFLLLLSGAALNSEHVEENFYAADNLCYGVKPGLFGGSAGLSLATVILGIICYLIMSSAKNKNNPRGPPPATPQGGIAMGRPQIPPQDPVFVHEDTYARRQAASV